MLKGEAFISIGVGGMDDEDTKLKKSKASRKKRFNACRLITVLSC